MAHAGQGSIGIFSDYMGFGDPDRLQYYMVAECEARVLLDSIRALKNLLQELKLDTVSYTSHFVAGFSQGGHAAFAAADYRLSYAPDVSLSGIIGYGPTTDIFSLFREYSDVAPMVLYTYSQLYGIENVDPSQILIEKFADNLERDLLRMCVGGMQSYYPHVPQGLFRDEFIASLTEETLERDYPDLFHYVEMNSTGLAGQRIPVAIYQGGNDIVIFPETQTQFVEKLRSMNVPVDYVFYKDARHDTRQISFEKSRTWIENHTK
nr:lipase family protein [Spirochaeta isovalerica]